MLQIKDIKKQYKTGGLVQKALDGVSLSFRDSEFVAVLGPSGSGKTTLLNIIGGLDRYDSGDLIINNISTRKYKDKDWDSYRNHTIGFVFQSYNLIPHQSVLANVELALTISGVSRSERKERAQKALEAVGLGDQLHKIPSQMSGGQMQRVAIARALVNNPDILLADEPTGALDSETSVQVMDLLKEVAKDRLVIMVTHNPELAELYATRIVKLRDGRIISDSDPFDPEAEGLINTPQHKNMGHAAMSFFTALQLSFNNLLTKKARTILVAFAGSIGIIGIALILSVSNGFNRYIETIEEDTLSEYPMEITNTSFSLASMMGGLRSERDDTDVVTELETISRLLSRMSSNDLASLKKYVDDPENGFDLYAKHVRYGYNVNPLVYRMNGDDVKQVNPYSVLSSFDNGMSSLYSGMSSFSMSMTEIFHEMPDDESLYKDQYDVKAGRWPEDYRECILVITDNGFVSDLALYAMGLADDSALEAAVKSYMSGGELDMESDEDTDKDPETFAYDEFIGVTFKLVNASDCYTYDPQYKVWASRTDNKSFMKDLVESSEDLTIVGVVKAKEDATSSMLNTGINYTYDLTRHVIETAASSGVVQAQLADPAVDVLTGKEFGTKEDQTIDLSQLFSVDQDAMKKAFAMTDISEGDDIFGDMSMDDISFDGILPDNISFGSISAEDMLSGSDLGSIDLSGLVSGGMEGLDLEDVIDMDALADSLPDITREDLIALLKSIKIDVNYEDMEKAVSELASGYEAFTEGNPSADISRLPGGIAGFLATEEARGIVTSGIRNIIREYTADMVTQEDLLEISEQVSSGFEKWSEENGENDIEHYGERLEQYLKSEELLSILRSSLEGILKRAADNVEQADLSSISDELEAAYQIYAEENGLPVRDAISDALKEYLYSEEAGNIINDNILSKIDTSEVEMKVKEAIAGMAASYTDKVQEQIVKMMAGSEAGGAIESAMNSLMQQIAGSVSSAISSQMSSIMGGLTAGIRDSVSSALEGYITKMTESMGSAFAIDSDALRDAVKMNMDQDELKDLLSSMMSGTSSTYDRNMKAFGYADFDKPYSILIYPRNFESKDVLTNMLEEYNLNMEESGQEEKVITYTDLVGTMMSSVTVIINAISYVLIAFVSISLVVSSIMIGVITYISVFERRKEIGILRSIGASKKNISSVFNAETIITGLLAGLFGVGISLLLLIPVNALLRYLTGEQNLVAFIQWQSALILIALSVVLTLIGGLIPSRKAANSDPVAALRNE